jgi:hypothetical protein
MATYSFTIAVLANAGQGIGGSGYWDPLRASIEACAEEVASLYGYRMTRLRAAHSAGDTTLNVESTYGFATSGYLLLQGETDVLAYSGIVQTPTAQQFTGVSPLEFDHDEEDEVIDWNRNTTQMDLLRRATLIEYADGKDLNRIARNNNITRPRPLVSDTDFRRLVKVLAWIQKNNIYAIELLLAALYPGGGYTIYESLVEHPCKVFITLPDEVGSTQLGRAFLTRKDDKTSTTATSVTVDKTPTQVISVITQPVEQTLDMSALPSAASPAWSYVAESAGAEGTYFSIVSNELRHSHPAGTDSGRYEKTIVEIDQLYNRIECAFKISSTTTVGGYPWKLFIRDGEREYALIWSDAAMALGQEDETLVSSTVAITPGTDWHRFRLERDGDWVHAFYDGARKISALASTFGASAGTLASFGYTDNGNANQWIVLWDDARIYSKSDYNWWNLPGTNGSVSTGSAILTDAGAPFAASDTGKIVFLNASNNVNYGTWLATYTAATQLTLSGISHTDGQLSTLTPTTFVTTRDRFASTDIGKTITVASGANAGDHVITAFTDARHVTCAASTLVTQVDTPWAFKVTFTNEAAIAYELTDAGTNAAAVLTLRQSLPQVNQPVTVHYADVESAQVLLDETVENTGGTLYYPFYIAGPDEWIKALLDDITAAGVIPCFSNPF